ncbi:MAG: alpha/beta hydrolase [Pseudomonadaceae bacterium]|nr:alpha/beta hydrolase [Pseudomonadaceae bacterium]
MNEQVEAFKRLLAESLGGPGGERSVTQMREGYEALGNAFPPGDAWHCDSVDAGGVAAELSHCGGSAPNTMLYLHGGGYVIGSLATHRGLVANIARATVGKVLAIDYRLAPEHPFPAAVDDAVSAYRWLLNNNHEPQNISVAGDSAGGGLTVATLLKLKREGLPLPAAGICISPWVDMEAVGESMDLKASVDPMVQREGLLGMAAAYLAGASPRDPLVAPIYGDLKGLPPLLIQVGTAETLLDDARRLATRAIADGVDVDYQEWPDMIHVFQHFAPMINEGYAAIERIGAFVRHHTHT